MLTPLEIRTAKNIIKTLKPIETRKNRAMTHLVKRQNEVEEYDNQIQSIENAVINVTGGFSVEQIENEETSIPQYIVENGQIKGINPAYEVTTGNAVTDDTIIEQDSVANEEDNKEVSSDEDISETDEEEQNSDLEDSEEFGQKELNSHGVF